MKKIIDTHPELVVLMEEMKRQQKESSLIINSDILTDEQKSNWIDQRLEKAKAAHIESLRAQNGHANELDPDKDKGK
jgi:hypothetical protein